MPKVLPVGVLIFLGNDSEENLADKAIRLGNLVMIGARETACVNLWLLRRDLHRSSNCDRNVGLGLALLRGTSNDPWREAFHGVER
jgi:hypothetical protein